MTEMITYKRLTNVDDIAEYRHLRWTVFRKPHGLPEGSEYQHGEYEANGYIGVFQGKKLIGGGFIIDRGEGDAQMHQIIIEEMWRRKGLATELISQLEALATERGLSAVYAHVRTYLEELYRKASYTDVPKTFSKSKFYTVHAPGVPHHFLYKSLV